MQPVLSPASEVQFTTANSEASSGIVGWALVMGIAIVSFLVHVHPGEGLAAEQAAQGLLVMGAAAVLAHSTAVRSADTGAVAGAADGAALADGRPTF